MAQNKVAIAKWLLSSKIDLEEAANITGLPVQQLRHLRDHLSHWAGRAFLPQELDIAIAALGARDKLTFVLVGANDGKSGDPIFHSIMRHVARVLLIEPQPWLVDDLRQSYRQFPDTAAIENTAVGPGGTTLDLHVLKREHWGNDIARIGRHPSLIFSAGRAQVIGQIALQQRPQSLLQQKIGGDHWGTVMLPRCVTAAGQNVGKGCQDGPCRCLEQMLHCFAVPNQTEAQWSHARQAYSMRPARYFAKCKITTSRRLTLPMRLHAGGLDGRDETR